MDVWIRRECDPLDAAVQTRLVQGKLNGLEIGCGFGFDFHPCSLLVEGLPVEVDKKYGLSIHPASWYQQQARRGRSGVSRDEAMVVGATREAVGFGDARNRDYPLLAFNMNQLLYRGARVSYIKIAVEGREVCREVLSLLRGVRFLNEPYVSELIVTESYKALAEKARALVLEPFSVRTRKQGMFVCSPPTGTGMDRFGFYLFYMMREWFPERFIIWDDCILQRLSICTRFNGFEIRDLGQFARTASHDWIVIAQGCEPTWPFVSNTFVNTTPTAGRHWERLLFKTSEGLVPATLQPWTRDELVMLRYYMLSLGMEPSYITDPVKDVQFEVIEDTRNGLQDWDGT